VFKELHKYIPEGALPLIEEWFEAYSFDFKITKKRQTKLGDFRASHRRQKNQITVNGNLNKYAFLITLTHEFAHLLVWENHKRRLQPHGIEWKRQFSLLLLKLTEIDVFPQDLKLVVEKHAENPSASSVKDVKLTLELNKYNDELAIVYLSELPIGTKFTINNKKHFIKGEKRRTRYLCTEVISKKQYLVHGVAEVAIC